MNPLRQVKVSILLTVGIRCLHVDFCFYISSLSIKMLCPLDLYRYLPCMQVNTVNKQGDTPRVSARRGQLLVPRGS